jgi:RNA polymerase sigma factor for flagellar operon FliA
MNTLAMEDPKKVDSSKDSFPATKVWQTYQGVGPGPIGDNDLIERFLPLVRNVVDRLKLTLPAHIDADDLYSVGVVGLLAAVRRYNPEQDNTFTGYAITRIRGSILDELRRMDWCPRRVRARAKKLKEVIGLLEQKIGRAATDQEICKELDMTPADYAKWLEESKPFTFIAIDQDIDSEGNSSASLHDILKDENDNTGRETLEKEELKQLLIDRIASLPEVPKKILSMYYFEQMRLAEIAVIFNLTESRICQIHAQTILGLRAYLDRARNA